MAEDSPHRRWRQRRLPAFDYRDPDHVYFVTLRAREGTAPFTDAQLAKAVIESLHWLRRNAGMTLYAYCLLPDHLHALLRPGGGEHLGLLLKRMKTFTTRESWSMGCSDQLWQPRFHDHILRRSEDGLEIVVYILANPERAGLVADGETYPYSGTPDPL